MIPALFPLRPRQVCINEMEQKLNTCVAWIKKCPLSSLMTSKYICGTDLITPSIVAGKTLE